MWYVLLMMSISLVFGVVLLILSLLYERKVFGNISTSYALLGGVSSALIVLMIISYLARLLWLVILIDYTLAVAIVLITYVMILKR
ncbi:MAG: hypothetical protein J7J75_00990 [Euryarchaeota archaeon]|nr:hypothetical protein [Euryarchaeota archaeon]MCD6158201.1 hypothetical protein [Euryarchaeota archaeon]